jgi:hypothetical protein
MSAFLSGPALRCPACAGPIGYWVLQPRFRCHHCGVVLVSNHRSVQWRLALAVLSLTSLGTACAALGLSWSAGLAAGTVGPALLTLLYLVAWWAAGRLVRLSVPTRP